MKNLLGFFALLFLLSTGFSACSNADTKQSAEKTAQSANNDKNPDAVQVVNKKKEEKTGYKIGETAADFNLKNIDGKMVSMSDFAEAKGFIVTFTCNHCPYAVMYEDRLIDLHNRYAPKGYPVIAINPNDPEVQKVKKFILNLVLQKHRTSSYSIKSVSFNTLVRLMTMPEMQVL